MFDEPVHASLSQVVEVPMEVEIICYPHRQFSWFTCSNSLVRRSLLTSKSLLDCSISALDWVKEMIFPRVTSTRFFQLSLCLIDCS